MHNEIELKLSTVSDLSDLLSVYLKQHVEIIQNYPIRQLDNTYFDTEALQLRQWDMGLRLRYINKNITQTLKAQGSMVSGLLIRPEYNHPLSQPTPDLSLLNTSIWPENTAIDVLEKQLIPLFTTGFKRHTWLIQFQHSQIECVYDRGQIISHSRSRDISEIELELIEGEVDDLFVFAQQLTQVFSLRIGYLSKAAWGYALLQNKEFFPQENINFVQLRNTDSVEQAFIRCIEFTLHYVQHHETTYIEKPSLSALKNLNEGIALLRHVLWLFEQIVPLQGIKELRKNLKWILNTLDWVDHARQLNSLLSKKRQYRKKITPYHNLCQLIEQKQQQHPSIDSVIALFSHSNYINTWLQLNQWLQAKNWLIDEHKQQQNILSLPIRQFTEQLLAMSWNHVRQLLPLGITLEVEDYIHHHKKIKRNFFTGTCVGYFFDSERRDQFRAPWVDLSKGIEEMKTLILIQQLCTESHIEQAKKIERWLENQIEGLWQAMEQSRTSALKTLPYWEP